MFLVFTDKFNRNMLQQPAIKFLFTYKFITLPFPDVTLRKEHAVSDVS